MNVYTATEQAYKNGYEAGVKEFAERLKKEAVTKCDWDDCVDVEDIDIITDELIDKQRKEDEKSEV